MPNLSDETLDLFVKHDVDLLRVDADLRKKIDGMMAGLNDKVKKRLTNFEYVNSNPVVQNKKLNQLVYVAASDSKKAFDQITNTVDAELKDLAVLQGTTVTDTLNKAIRVDLASNQVHLAKLKALAGNAMIEGAPVKEWWARQAPNFVEQFKDQIRAGMLNQETMGDIIRRVQGSRESGYQDGIIARAGKRAHRLVRTSVLAVANEARMETYKVNSDVIKGVQWVSTLDNRTSDICKALDGQAWTLDGRRMKGTTQSWQGPPPAHWNCRSTTIPITKTFSELARDNKNKKKFAGLDKATKNKFRASANGKQAANINYEQWLRRRPISEQKEILGPTKYRLWNEDKISFTDLIDQNHNPLSVAQLVKKAKAEYVDDFMAATTKVWTPAEYRLTKKIISEAESQPFPSDYMYRQLEKSGFKPEVDFKRSASLLNKDARAAAIKFMEADKAIDKFPDERVKEYLRFIMAGNNRNSSVIFKDVYLDPKLVSIGLRKPTINKVNEYLDRVANKFLHPSGLVNEKAVKSYLGEGVIPKAVPVKAVAAKPVPAKSIIPDKPDINESAVVNQWKKLATDTDLDANTNWEVRLVPLSHIRPSQPIDHLLKNKTTKTSLLGKPIKIDINGNILDGNHRFAEAINRKYGNVIVLKPRSLRGKGSGLVENNTNLSFSQLERLFNPSKAKAKPSLVVDVKPKKPNFSDVGPVKGYSFNPKNNIDASAVFNELPIKQRNDFHKFMADRNIVAIFPNASGRNTISKGLLSDFLEHIQKPELSTNFYTKKTKPAGWTNRLWKHVTVRVKQNTDFSSVKLSELQASVRDSIKRATTPLNIKGGSYFNRPTTMSSNAQLLYDYNQKEVMTLIHELGHQVHYYAGKVPVPNQFRLGSTSTKFKSLTEYGSQVDAEWHAEHFVAWLIDRDALARWDNDIANYFDNLMAVALKSRSKEQVFTPLSVPVKKVVKKAKPVESIAEKHVVNNQYRKGALESWETKISEQKIPDEFIKAYQDNFAKAIASPDTVPGIRTPYGVLTRILRDGQFKNQLQTGSSKGLLDKTFRREIESHMFGITGKAAPKYHPIYGYLNDGTLDKDYVAAYGELDIKLKPSVKTRATFVSGDSMNLYQYSDIAPSSISNPSIHSISPDLIYDRFKQRLPKRFDSKLNNFSKDYVEMQVHGGLSVSDIQEVVFPKLDINKPPFVMPKYKWEVLYQEKFAIQEKLKKNLDDAGIKWRDI